MGEVGVGGESESSRGDSFHQMDTAVLLQPAKKMSIPPAGVADPRKV